MEYLLKASAVTIIFYVCYKLFLQRETFFEQNRWFLLVGLVAAFIIPFLLIPVYIEYEPVILQNYAPVESIVSGEIREPPFNIFDYLPYLYVIGVVAFSGGFVLQLVSLIRVLITNKVERSKGYRFVKTTENTLPFSFFKWIVYNPSQFKTEELDHILMHEKVHVNQFHSIDSLLVQISSIVLWFNPIIWFYNKDLKQNLEFIADKHTQNKIGCNKSYQYTLLKTSAPSHQLAITNNFYNSLIKKRIVMLQKSKSKKINHLKCLLILPVLGWFLMSFNTEEIYVEKENLNTSLSSQHSYIGNEVNKRYTSCGTYLEMPIDKNYKNEDFNKIEKFFDKNFDTSIQFKDIKRNNLGEITSLGIEGESINGKFQFKQSDINSISAFVLKTCYANRNQFIEKYSLQLKPSSNIEKQIGTNVNVYLAEINKKSIDDAIENNLDTQKPVKSDTSSSVNENKRKITGRTIYNNFTDRDFKNFSNKLKSEGFEFNLKEVKRNSDGLITSINFIISKNGAEENYKTASGMAVETILIQYNKEENKFIINKLGFTESLKKYKSDETIKIVIDKNTTHENFESKKRFLKEKHYLDSDFKILEKNEKGEIKTYSFSIGKGKNSRKITTSTEKSQVFLYNPNASSIISYVINKNGDPEYGAAYNLDKRRGHAIQSKNSDENLKSIKESLEEKNITAKFSDVKRNQDGQIVSINITAQSKTGSIINYDSKNNDKPITTIFISYYGDGNEVRIGSSMNQKNKKETNTNEKSRSLVINDSIKKSIIESIKIRMNEKLAIPENALYVVDGKISNIKGIKKGSELAEKIKDLNILKGNEAIEKYGVKGKNGVVEIKTQNISKTTIHLDKNKNPISSIGIEEGKEPMYIVNGKISSRAKALNIKRNNFKSIIVLKGQEAIEKYGKKAKDGTIEIITKE